MRVLRQCLLLALYLPSSCQDHPSVQIHPLDRISVNTYLMVLPVRSLIHCGIGRFCFCALASLTLVRKLLCDWFPSTGLAFILPFAIQVFARGHVQASWVGMC